MKPPIPDAPLLILDYDGTLAEVADRPHLAVPYQGVRELLRHLDERHPLAILTGRQVEDVSGLLDVPGLRVVGVHGIEEGVTGGSVRRLVPDEVVEQLSAVHERLPDLNGLEVEDKTAAIALHYRNAPDPAGTKSALEAWSRDLPDALEALWGKRVLEIRPRGYDKGGAAQRLRAEHPDRTPVVIGDDTTDEEAFRAVPDGVTIKVGKGETAATYRLPGVPAVVAYLEGFLTG